MRAAQGSAVVGREREWDRLSASLELGVAMLLTGEAGSGKTYLARSFASAHFAGGREPDHGDVPAVAGLPALRERSLAALSPLLGRASINDRNGLEGAVEALAEHPILFVDDVDALDPDSAVVLHRLASRRVHPWLLLTLRDGRPLPPALETLVVDGTLDQMRLAAFDEVSVARLAENLLDGPVAATSTHTLYLRSAGNPLLVRELVSAGWDAEQWVQRSGDWTLLAEPDASDRLRSLLPGRLDRLSKPGLRTAQTLALCGPLTPEALYSFGVVDGVQEVLSAGVAITRAGEVALADPSYAQSLAAAMPAELQQDTLTAALELAQQERLDGPVAPRLIAAATRSGLPVDPAVLVDAAAAALAHGDLVTVRTLAEGPQVRGEAGDRMRLIAATAAARLGEPHALQELAVLTDHENRELSGEAGEALARFTVAGPGGPRAALQALHGLPGVTAGVLRAVAHLRLTEWTAAEHAATEAVAAAEGGPGWVDAAGIAALLLTSGNDVPTGLALALRGLAMVDAGHPAGPEAPLLLAHAATVGAVFSGQPTLATTVAGHTAPEVGRTRVHSAHRHMRRGHVHLRRGGLASAARELENAAALLRSDDPVDILSWTLGQLAQAHAMRNDLSAARSALQRGWAVAPPEQLSHRVELVRAEAWIAAAEGDRRTARERLGFLLEHGEDTPVRSALVQLDVARLGEPRLAAQEILGPARASGSTVLDMVARMLASAADGDADALLAEAGTLVGAGFPLWAADLLAACSMVEDCPFPELLRARALLLALACEEAHTPALRRLPQRLTPAQQQVARLAAQGASHRQVAERLGLSPRTAATHLHRAYKLLGVHSREELVELLG